MIGLHASLSQPLPGIDDMLIFWLVVAARFLVPLLIPRFPLPAILAALVLDAADQTIFQTFTTLPLDGYQNYDKALDIYYLTIAYISTLRNWTNGFAFRLSRFLFYYRLVGVVLFEFTGVRAMLLFFPNVFEYFFIAYEVLRLRYDPVRLSPAALLALAGGIWVFIKIPQEYWIHIAQLDVTDTIGALFASAVPGSPLGTLVGLWPILLMVMTVGLLIGLAIVWGRLPAPDWRWQVDADAARRPYTAAQVRHAKSVWSQDILDRDLAEKTVLITLLSLIFAQILPGVTAPPWLLVLALVVFVGLNTVVSHVLARRGIDWSTTLSAFAATLALNGLFAVGYTLIMRRLDPAWSPVNLLFFVLLLSLIIALYDRYQRTYLARFPAAWVRVPRG